MSTQWHPILKLGMFCSSLYKMLESQLWWWLGPRASQKEYRIQLDLEVLHDSAIQTEPNTQRQNRAEVAIRNQEKVVQQDAVQGSPKNDLGFWLMWVSETTNRTARGLDARASMEELTGNTLQVVKLQFLLLVLVLARAYT